MSRAHPGVFVLLLGVVILYTWPLVTDLAHLYPDNPDARVQSSAHVRAGPGQEPRARAASLAIVDATAACVRACRQKR